RAPFRLRRRPPAMFARLLAESLRRGRRRKLLAATVVGASVAAATALGALLLAAGDRLAAELASYGANIPPAPDTEGRTLPLARLAAVRGIFWRNNIVALAPLLPLAVVVEPAADVVPLVATWFDVPLDEHFRTGLPRTRPTLRVSGRFPRDGAS